MATPDPRQARLLRAALDLPTAERDAFVVRESGTDAALLARLRQLLALDAATALPLDRPADAVVAQWLAADEADDTDATGPQPQAGMRVGPWRLVRELGHGGMGSVWLAARDDGQFQQQVALKLIRLGMDSEHVTRQFRRERALLARLQHPNIAQLIDGGLDERGRPWFAMEYIDGLPLGAWLATAHPGLRARLQLFAKLCRAVAHAHRQLIVHRDLKPSNVLVRADGEPCLLDFGIARLVEDEAPEHTVTAQRFLTRDYASPEQLRGEPAGTSADVYALGLILFELLTGQRYRKLHHRGEATLRPSASVAADGNATTGADITRTRLRGDLDAITLRALAEEPARRYADAQQLADDVQRHLDGQPVTARPDSLAYRVAKFARRNRAAVAVGALGFAAWLAASGVALWQAAQKGAEAERARVALRQSESVREFMQSLFLGADPMRTKGVGTTAGELIAAARARIAHELGGEPLVAAELLDQIGNTYVSLGEDALARDTLREALDFNARAATPSLRVAASAGGRLAHYAFLDGDAAGALAELDRLIGLLEAHGTGVELVLSKTLQLKANALFNSGRSADALQESARSVAVLQPQARRWNAEYVSALVSYADAAAGVDHGAEALQAADTALAQPLLAHDDAPAAKLAALGAKARALQSLHRLAEAEPVLAEVIAGQGALYGANASRTRYWLYRRAQLLQDLGRLDEAQTTVDALLARPADDADQPIARVAAAFTAAAIAIARQAPDVAERISLAQALACDAAGNGPFCAKARQLRPPPR